MGAAKIVTPRYAGPVDYGFTIHQTDDGYAISYRRQKWGWVLPCVIALALVMPWFLINGLAIKLLNPPVTSTGVLWAFAVAWPLSAISGYLIVGFLNARRRNRTILVSSQFVEADGKRYERSHITDLYVKAPRREEVREPIIQNRDKNLGFITLGASGAMGGGGIAAAGLVAAHQTAEDLGRAVGFGVIGSVNAMFRSWGWSICIGYGSQPVRLVRGLSGPQAEAMANDLGNLLRS